MTTRSTRYPFSKCRPVKEIGPQKKLASRARPDFCEGKLAPAVVQRVLIRNDRGNGSASGIAGQLERSPRATKFPGLGKMTAANSRRRHGYSITRHLLNSVADVFNSEDVPFARAEGNFIGLKCFHLHCWSLSHPHTCTCASTCTSIVSQSGRHGSWRRFCKKESYNRLLPASKPRDQAGNESPDTRCRILSEFFKFQLP